MGRFPVQLVFPCRAERGHGTQCHRRGHRRPCAPWAASPQGISWEGVSHKPRLLTPKRALLAIEQEIEQRSSAAQRREAREQTWRTFTGAQGSVSVLWFAVQMLSCDGYSLFFDFEFCCVIKKLEYCEKK